MSHSLSFHPLSVLWRAKMTYQGGYSIRRYRHRVFCMKLLLMEKGPIHPYNLFHTKHHYKSAHWTLPMVRWLYIVPISPPLSAKTSLNSNIFSVISFVTIIKFQNNEKIITEEKAGQLHFRE